MKKLKIIGLSVLALLVALYIVAWFGMRSEAREQMRQCNQWLVEAILNLNRVPNDTDALRLWVEKPDGSKLNDQELRNFLVNTGLYRLTFLSSANASKITYSQTVDFDLLNADSGSVRFSFRALDGDVIVTTLEYRNGCFVTRQYSEPTKKLQQYRFAMNEVAFALLYDQTAPTGEIKFWRIIAEQDYGALELYEEFREDARIILSENFQLLAENWEFRWNEAQDQFFVQTDEPGSLKNRLLTSALTQYCVSKNALSGNGDWHMSVLFYDGSELLQTLVVR